MATQGHHQLPALPPQTQQQQQEYQQYQQYQQQPSPQQYQQQQHQDTQQQLQQRQPQGQQQPQQIQRQTPRQQHPQQDTRPPSSQKPATKPRSFSFRSDKSHGSNHKTDLHETSAEKDAKRLHSKADPTLAMNEAEPSAVQATVKSSLAPLRAIQHRDSLGNPIAEPDRSNPTRSRWERPLDTIRSFEAAIDGGYSRKSFIRSDTDSAANWNRRSSYYGNNGPRFPHDSYYGGRPQSFRPESALFDGLRMPTRDSLVDPHGYNGNGMGNGNGNGMSNGNGNGYGMGAGPSRQRASRMQSQPELGAYGRGESSVYPVPHKDRSYETVTSAAGSGSSAAEPAGYQTDPTSSENSSIDRASPVKPGQPMNDYGIGFNQSPTYQPQAFTVGANPAYQGGPVGGQQNVYQGKSPAVPRKKLAAPLPPLPPKDAGLQRRPPGQQYQQQPQQHMQERPDMGGKRKSWFTRRFSKAS